MKHNGNVTYTNANKWITPEIQNSWIQYIQSDQDEHDNAFQAWDFAVPVLYTSWTPLTKNSQFQ